MSDVLRLVLVKVIGHQVVSSAMMQSSYEYVCVIAPVTSPTTSSSTDIAPIIGGIVSSIFVLVVIIILTVRYKRHQAKLLLALPDVVPSPGQEQAHKHSYCSYF